MAQEQNTKQAGRLNKDDLKVLRQIRVTKEAAEKNKKVIASASTKPVWPDEDETEEADKLTNNIILHRLMRIFQVDDDEEEQAA